MKKITFCFVLLFSCLTATKTFAQDGYIGEIRMVGFNFAPRGWAMCDGQLIPIQQNTALFSLLGVNYGGNGTTNFALPDLRGRAPIHAGASQGPGLSPVALGQMSGQESVTLTQQNLPSHTHLINATTADGTSGDPTGNIPANTKLLDKEYSNVAPNTTMNSTMVLPSTGQSFPVNNMQPYLGVYYIICTQGIYPPRN